MKYGSNVIVGQIGEGDVNASKQIRDVTETVHSPYEDNSLSPVLALLSRIKRSEVVRNIKHEWIKKDFFPRWDTVSAITSGNGTATIVLTPGDVDIYTIGDTVEFFNGSGGATTYGVVEAKSTTITVNSLDGTTLLPTLSAGNSIHVIGRSQEEIGGAPTGKNVKQEFEYNYPQLMRYPTEIGIFELGTKQYSGPEEKERMKEQHDELRMSIERTMLFSERGKQAGVGGKTQCFTRGHKRWVETGAGNNVLSWSGSLTESTFREWLIEGPCKYGSNEKFFPMSAELFMQIDSWAGTKQRIESAGGQIKVLGFNVVKYLAPNGKILNMHLHHMYEEEYAGWGSIIDLQNNMILPYGNNPIIGFKSDTQENDEVSKEFEWRGLFVYKNNRPERDGLIKFS